MAKQVKEVEIGFAIKKVGVASYYDYNNEVFTSEYSEDDRYSAKLFDTIEDAESCILEAELEYDGEDFEIVKIEKCFKTLERYKRIKKVEHEKLD